VKCSLSGAFRTLIDNNGHCAIFAPRWEMNWTPNLPATLYRLPDPTLRQEKPGLEEIGSGPLAKMVRIALSDPDDEIWRYSINVAGTIVRGPQISTVAKALGSDALPRR
jgi:hypothetical protein